MAKRITAYQSNDGLVFHTAAECDAHNTSQARTTNVAGLLAELGLADAVGIAIKDPDDEAKLNVTPLPTFLIQHADKLIKALKVDVAAPRGRKPADKKNIVKGATKAKPAATVAPTAPAATVVSTASEAITA